MSAHDWIVAVGLTAALAASILVLSRSSNLMDD